ncbi:MAG TPA: hypothetical protein VNU01_05555, partial [Egibacteraceae bacterium]|nr:hypothetical protein [Egibacteraceae bacterium]
MSETREPASRAPLGVARLALAGFTVLALGAVGLEISRTDVTTTLEPRARRPAAVVTDGRRILEVEARTGRVVSTLLALPTTGEERVVAVAPRPGTFHGLPLVVLSSDPDGPLLWWIDEGGHRRDLPASLARPEVEGGPRSVDPVPVWSPDGSSFAWLEGPHQSPRLRVAAWSADGPREGDERHSGAVLGRGLGPGARLEAWRWDLPGRPGMGTFLISDDQPGLSQVEVRSEDGHVRPLNGRPRRLPGAIVDRADAGRGQAGGPWPRYQLVLPMGEAPQLRWLTGAGASGTLPLPDGLGGSRSRW